MQCNIDKRGRRVRLVLGIAVLLAGIALCVLVPASGLANWWYILAAVLLLAGAFAVFEARNGWCAVRAMGFRTPV